jgi:hypothetical protein
MSAFIVSEDNLYRVINSITKIEGYTKDLKEIKEQAISQPKQRLRDIQKTLEKLRNKLYLNQKNYLIS